MGRVAYRWHHLRNFLSRCKCLFFQLLSCTTCWGSLGSRYLNRTLAGISTIRKNTELSKVKTNPNQELENVRGGNGKYLCYKRKHGLNCQLCHRHDKILACDLEGPFKLLMTKSEQIISTRELGNDASNDNNQFLLYTEKSWSCFLQQMLRQQRWMYVIKHKNDFPQIPWSPSAREPHSKYISQGGSQGIVKKNSFLLPF
jgi:hypothetical protein